MGLDGGGGGGGGILGVSGGFTGPAESLEIAGEHAYAYSGLYPASQTSVQVLSFTSGNFILVGQFELHGFVDQDNPGSRTGGLSQISFNGTRIVILSTVAYRSPMFDKVQVVIPPYTEITATIDAEADQANMFGALTLVGRIYRG